MSHSLVSNPKRSNPIAGPGSTIICDFDETLGRSIKNPSFIDEIYNNSLLYKEAHPIGADPVCYSIHLEYDGPLEQYDNGGKPLTFWGVYRPGAIEFLNFAHQRFENVVVWSAGIKPYVDTICSQMMRGPGTKHPKLIYSREQCKYNPTQKNFHKPITHLADLVDKEGHSLNIDPKKTLIIDDKQYTFVENPNNAILIPPFHPGRDHHRPTAREILDRSDRCLYQLMDWMNKPGILTAPDYRTLNKSYIFT
jgi:hypothetical protein